MKSRLIAIKVSPRAGRRHPAVLAAAAISFVLLVLCGIVAFCWLSGVKKPDIGINHDQQVLEESQPVPYGNRTNPDLLTSGLKSVRTSVVNGKMKITPSSSSGPQGGQPGQVLSEKELSTLAENSCVFIRGTNASGTGFFINADGDILTNYHVLAGEDKVTVITFSGKSYDVDSVIRYSIPADLAVLHINGQLFPHVSLRQDEPIRGEPVVLMGHPQGSSWIMTKGYVAGWKKIGQQPFLQFSADISPGNSGGAVLDSCGHVCAVATLLALNKVDFQNGVVIPDPSMVFKFGVTTETIREFMLKPANPAALSYLSSFKRNEDVLDNALQMYQLLDKATGDLIEQASTNLFVKNITPVYKYDIFGRVMFNNGVPVVNKYVEKVTLNTDAVGQTGLLDGLSSFLNEKMNPDKVDVAISKPIVSLKLALYDASMSVSKLRSLHGTDPANAQAVWGEARTFLSGSQYYMREGLPELVKAYETIERPVYVENRMLAPLQALASKYTQQDLRTLKPIY